ncbi:hypothetical protein FRC07_004965, partial [Ceratobasidium sp. 392]
HSSPSTHRSPITRPFVLGLPASCAVPPRPAAFVISATRTGDSAWTKRRTSPDHPSAYRVRPRPTLGGPLCAR